MKIKLPALAHNLVSYVGMAVSALSIIAIVFLFILSTLNTMLGRDEAPYAGIIVFIILPGIMFFGFFLILVGMLRERAHLRRTGSPSMPTLPVVDFNDPRQRNVAAILSLGGLVLLFSSVFGSFQAYEATESVTFCGATCHTVMEPEFVTYQNSPHARVRCVDCHVGPGAGWYVKSKLSGLYQVYAVAFDKYPRPIPGTIEDLRPAQDTCEQCHWPEKFFGAQQKRLVSYLSDEKNTRWQIDLLLKVGGTEAVGQQGHGIHWHMNIANKVEYIATDDARQTIPWIRTTNSVTGETVVYTAAENALTPDQVAAAEKRVMDCIDCHNRPSHILRSPKESVDQAIEAGRIDGTLPSIKAVAVKILKENYDSTEAALAAIESGILGHYREQHPEIAQQRRNSLAAAVSAVQEIYRNNFFPKMKARWDVYPINAGHVSWPGCMRCHDGNHKSADGKAITNTCTACHIITAQGLEGEMQFSGQADGLEFVHPGDEVGDMWQSMLCTDCHAGE